MEIQQIKEQLSIQTVVDHYGWQVRKGNRLCCPFHDDKVPSMQVYPENNTLFCFSSNCDHHGKVIDVIDAIMFHEQITKYQAILKAKELLGHQRPVGEMGQTVVMNRFWERCKRSLQRAFKAVEYMESRGLRAVEYGYCSDKSNDNWSKELQQVAEKYGLFTGKKPFLRYCVVFPLRDQNGNIVSFYGRSILKEGNAQAQGKHFYLKNRSGLFLVGNQQPKRLILTEGVLDALSIPLEKEEAVLALFGSSLQEEQQLYLKDNQCIKEVILFLDGDSAGVEASQKLSRQLNLLLGDISVKMVEVGENQDPNSILQNQGKEVLKNLLHQTKIISEPEKEKKEIREISVNPSKSVIQRSKLGYTFTTTTATYYTKGSLPKDVEHLRISLHIENELGRKFRCKPDLYDSRQVERLAREAGDKLGIRADLLEEDLNELTDLLEKEREAQSKPIEKEAVKVNPLLEQEVKNFAKRPDLMAALNEKIGLSGVVGEEENRLFLFGIAATYKMPDTLHALIQGSSGSGKTHLLSKISKLMPQESVITLTRVTESSFYNYGTYELKNKLMCFEDLDGMKEDAFFAFRELQSSGKLSSGVSTKDESGSFKTVQKPVYGPIASLSATTHGEIYEDNMSRCFLVAVDESQEQTQRVISYQNQLAAGLIDKSEQEQAKAFLQVFVRLLKPMEVINPYADKIHLPKEAHKIRRLNELYQQYVKLVTLFHQYQRKQDRYGRLISEQQDLELACSIMFESIMLKVDELDGSLRHFFENLKSFIQQACGVGKVESFEFSQREVRQALGLGKTQVAKYISSLIDYEYVVVSGGYINRGFRYRVMYWDNNIVLRKKVKAYMDTQIQAL